MNIPNPRFPAPGKTSIYDFCDRFSSGDWLEDDSLGNSRWSNGLGEGSDHESEWFHGKTGEWLQGYSRDDESYFEDGEII